jgi:hypothetical protein
MQAIIASLDKNDYSVLRIMYQRKVLTDFLFNTLLRNKRKHGKILN